MITFSNNNYSKKLITYEKLVSIVGGTNAYVDLSNPNNPIWIPIFISYGIGSESETYTATWNFDASGNSIMFDIHKNEGGVFWYYGSLAANKISMSTLSTSNNGWYVVDAEINVRTPLSGYTNGGTRIYANGYDSTLNDSYQIVGSTDTPGNKVLQFGETAAVTGIKIKFK